MHRTPMPVLRRCLSAFDSPSLIPAIKVRSLDLLRTEGMPLADPNTVYQRQVELVCFGLSFGSVR